MNSASSAAGGSPSGSGSGSGKIFGFSGVRVTIDKKLEYITIFKNKQKKYTDWVKHNDIPVDANDKQLTTFYQYLERKKVAESNEFKYCQKPSKEAMDANNDGKASLSFH